MSTTHTVPKVSQKNKGMRLFVFCVVIAFLITGYRYLTPLSGITAAGGALLVLVGELVLIACASGVMLNNPSAFRTFLIIVLWIGTILSCIAELFLHGWTSAMLLVVAAVGLIYFGVTDCQKRSV